MVDMAHIAGLVAAGIHPNPVPHAHFVTTTTHKTLRGPRGGVILCEQEFAKKIDSSVFPGMQGGPLMHVIAAKATAFKEALSDDFKGYAKQVVKNAAVFAEELSKAGVRLVSGGTDNHLLLLDVKPLGFTGKDAEEVLDSVLITTNKNTVPFDTEGPFITSGVRIGTAAVTTRGFKEEEIKEVADIMVTALKNHENKEVLEELKQRVLSLNARFPLYKN